MPYQIVHLKHGYKVQNKDTKKTYSLHPLSKIKAEAQLKALHIHTKK
jgi:hypothetical protein